jgi:hypothetical protein
MNLRHSRELEEDARPLLVAEFFPSSIPWIWYLFVLSMVVSAGAGLLRFRPWILRTGAGPEPFPGYGEHERFFFLNSPTESVSLS